MAALSAIARAFAGLFLEQERPVQPATPSAAALNAERRRYSRKCLLLGLEACRRNDARRAMDTFHEAFIGYQQTGDRKAASLVQKAIGLVAQKIETPAKVRTAFAQARRMLQEAGLHDEEARALFLLADFEAKQTAYDAACVLYEDSLKLSRSIGYLDGEVECLCRYGWTLQERGQVDDAKRRILEARKVAQDHGDEAMLARVTKWVKRFGESQAAASKTAKGVKKPIEKAPPPGAKRDWKPIAAAKAGPGSPQAAPPRAPAPRGPSIAQAAPPKPRATATARMPTRAKTASRISKR